MTVLYDARGNEIQGSLLDQIGGGTVTDARVSSGVLGALNAELVMDLNGMSTASFDFQTAAMNASIVFEGTVDGSTYYAMMAWVPLNETFDHVVTIVAGLSQLFQLNCAGYRRVRVRVSAYISGTCVVAGRASASNLIAYSRTVPSTLQVTATAAVNTAVTCTIPAPGSDAFHYFTSIQLVKLYSVVGVAAGAGVVITTTNLVGNPSWTTEQAAGAVGTAPKVIDERNPHPLKSSIANIATTFVAPAQLQTIWRWNVQYYIAG